MHTANLVLLLLIAVAVPVTHAQFDFNFDNPFGGLFDDFYSDGSNPDDYSYGYSQNGFSFGGSEYSTWDKSSYFWSSSFSYFYSSGFGADFFPSEGEILPGVTFSDAMNTLGKAMNKGNIRKSMASLCNDMEGILGEFLEDSEDICEYITQVAENDEAIEGLTDLCLSIELPDSYDSYSWGDSWNHQYDWLEGEHWVDKRSVNGEVVSRNKRAIFLNDNDEESVSYLERLLFDSVAEEFGIDNKTNVVACQAIGHHIINGNKNMSAAFRDIIYYATAVIVEVGFKYCPRNDSSVYSGRSDEFDGVTETPSYSNSASDYSYSASDSDDYSGSSKGFSDYSYWYEETEYFLSDVDIIGVLAQTVLGDYNTSQSCDRLFTANETGSLEIFRQEMTDGAIQMLTDYDQCVSNFMISNETNGPVIAFYFGSTNYTEICAALVRSSVEPEEEVKLELDLFWFYHENWWDYYSWNDDYSGSNDYSSNSWIGDYSEKSDYSWSEDYSWSDGYSWYNDSGDYSWQYDIWNGYELDWMFTFELLSPHITPTSWLSVLGKLYNAGNASDAFVDFCYALPDELYVFQMEEMCDGILSGDIDAWFESCYQLGADGSGDGFEEDWDEDWVYWDLYGFFDWYDEWEEWRDPYYNGWRWDYNLYDLSWVILEPVAEVFGVNDLNEEDTCKKIGRQMERRGKAMNETIIDILHLWAAKTAGIGLTYCKQTEDYDGDYSLSVSDDGSDSFNAYSASWSWWLSWENSLWDDWSDGWGGNWDDYHWDHDNTYFSDMDILGLTVSTLRGDPHPRESCSDIITYYRNESLDIFNQSLVDGVLNILGNQTLCFVNFNITQYYHPGFLETFFRSDDVTDVCNMLTRAFTDPDDLELEMDFFWFFQEDSYSEDSISWLDYANYWTEDFDDVNWIVVFDFLAPHITPESWISLLGNTYNARNLSAAFLDFCSALPDELYDFEMKEMCLAVSQGNYYEWQYSCEELAYGWWRKDLWDWDYGSDSYSWNDGSDSYSWNDWYSWDSWSSDGYDYSDEYDWGTYEVENFLRGLYFALEYSMEVIHGDVYDMCDFGGEFLDADNEEYNAKFDEILGNISIYLMHWAHGTIGCSQSDYYSDSFSFSDINWWIQEDMVLYNAISGVVLGLGRYESGEDFCTDYEEHSSEIDVMGRQFVANFYKITTSKTKCVKYFETIESFISDATAEMYGYSSFSNLCTYIVDTFEDSDIDLEEPDLDEEEIPLAFVIGIMAKLKSRDYVIDVATEVCDDYAGILSFAFSDREAVDICSSVRDSDITSLVSQCEEALVPLIYGDGFPVGLKPFPEDQFINAMMTGLFGIDLNDVSDETPCEVLETVVNGDKGLIELAEDTLDLALGELIPWLGGVCEGRDFIINEMFYGDDEYSYSWYNWNSYSTEEEFISLEDVDVMVGIVTGKGSVAGVCDDIIQAANRGEQAVQSLAVDLREALFSIITNPGRCRLLVSSVNDKAKEVLPISADEESSELLEEFTWLTGYTTVDGFCEALVAAMTQEEVEECRGIEDCAGVCNGDATRDCAGVCNGAADHDCAGQCNGAAYINNCTECVGGRTGRPWYFGADRCGNCKAFKGYYEAWDCYGTCDGTAYRDRCGTCIGGSTGRDETFNEDRLDCRSICDGAWEEDTCGFCEPASFVSYVGGSKYMDCSSTCVTPGFSRATENDCGECVGGSSGLDSDYGYNVCGQCEADPDADETSCQGCDGIPNSGQVFDTCGVCGGDGSNCVGVGTVVPDYIPNRSVLVTVFGAGFTADSELTCVFYDEDGVKTEGEVVDRWSNVVIICEADLSPGEYEVGVKRDSDNPNNIRANIKVYEDVTVTSFTPTEVDIDPSLSEQEFNITIVVSGSPFTAMESETDYSVVPSLIIEDASGSTFVYYGEFISANEFIVPIQMPRASGQYTLSPSVNHVHGLGTETYTGTIYYPAPSMEEAKFSDTGAALVVYFDLSVEFRTMTGCDDIFDDVSGLGAGAGCYAIGTKVLVVLFGKYDGTTLLTPGDTLTLKSNSVKSFNQEYSRSGTGSETIQSADSPPQVTALLSGPETLPSCGYVKMDGRKSTGSGARALTYVWSVSSSGSTSAVDSTLASINAENSNNGVAAVEFDGADMDANKPYEFIMSVTNFLGESDSTSLTITRSGVAAPEVKVIVEGTDADAALIADSFGLTAEVKYYSACVAAGETQFQWSVNNSDVPLNLKTMYTRRLYVPANTLPGGEALEFTVRVFKSSNVSAYVETTVTVVTIQSDLIAVIDGGQEFTVGRDSGNLVLNAGNSIDPDEEARAWEYEWQCLQNTDNSACWSFNPDTVGYLIINDTNIGDSQLSFDALSLEADKEYIFTVTVRKNDRSAFTSVTISAVDGNPPKILLESDDEDAIVNDDEYVIFSATITHEADIDNIQWETADTDLGYGYIDFDDESNMLFSPLSYSLFSGSTLALIGIQKGVVSRGTEYAITVTVDTTDGQNSTAKAYLTVRSGPTSCDFTVPDHEELDEVVFLMENCVTSADAYPLSFQLFVEKSDGSYEAVTEKKSEPSINGIGKPKLDSSDTRTYLMNVCDRNDMCTEYDVTATVTEKSSFSEAEISDFKANNVDAKKYAGDTLGALTNRNMLPDAGSDESSRRRRAAETTSDVVTEQLELVQLTIANSVLDSSSVSALIDQIESISTDDMNLEDQSTFLGYLEDVINVYLDEGTAISTSAATILLGKCSDIAYNLDTLYNANILDLTRIVQMAVAESMTSDLSVGAPSIEINNADKVTTVQKTILSGSFGSKSTGDVISIDFGSELSSLYGASWSCGSDTCSGVSLTVTHYDSTYDYFSTDSSDISTYRMCDVITIEIANPDTGQQLNVSDLTSPIIIGFPITRNVQSVTPSCVYWDDAMGEWSTDGMTVSTESSTEITCESNHLTTFSVVGIPLPTTQASYDYGEDDYDISDLVDGIVQVIIWVVVGILVVFVLIVVLIVLIVVVIFTMTHTKKAPANPRVTQPPPQPQPIQMQHVQPTHTVQIAPVAQPGYYPSAAPSYGAPLPPPPSYSMANPYAGLSSSSQPPPPSVTLVAPSGNLVKQDLYAGKDDAKSQGGGYSDYMSAVTSGLPGIDGGVPFYSTDPAVNGSMPGVEMSNVTPRNVNSAGGSHVSLTRHE